MNFRYINIVFQQSTIKYLFLIGFSILFKIHTKTNFAFELPKLCLKFPDFEARGAYELNGEIKSSALSILESLLVH